MAALGVAIFSISMYSGELASSRRRLNSPGSDSINLASSGIWMADSGRRVMLKIFLTFPGMDGISKLVDRISWARLREMVFSPTEVSCMGSPVF